MTYEVTGGDHGSYKITEGNKAAPVAFVRRNQTGGGYTVRMADDSKSIQVRNLPATETSDQQAAEIMVALLSAPTHSEVRAAHKAVGNEVKITRDGRVTYRPEGTTAWLEGRWVEEYRRNDCGEVVV